MMGNNHELLAMFLINIMCCIIYMYIVPSNVADNVQCYNDMTNLNDMDAMKLSGD